MLSFQALGSIFLFICIIKRSPVYWLGPEFDSHFVSAGTQCVLTEVALLIFGVMTPLCRNELDIRVTGSGQNMPHQGGKSC